MSSCFLGIKYLTFKQFWFLTFCARYGKYLNLLKEHAENGLCFVLMNCEKFLKKQQRTVVSSLCILPWWHKLYCLKMPVEFELSVWAFDGGVNV